jgi:thiol-disulfide isomerase/thioredoxin
MKPTICFLAILCPILSIAQPKPLQPGDMIPHQILQIIYTATDQQTSQSGSTQQQSAHSQISQSANQLFILDFWATWCGSCAKKFPLLDSLQQHFGNQLNIVLVNGRKTKDDTAKINTFMGRLQKAGQPANRFRMIINDTILDKYFPHTALPHYVWIYNNRYRAATNAQELTIANINAVLQGALPPMEQKNDSLRRQQLLQKGRTKKSIPSTN